MDVVKLTEAQRKSRRNRNVALGLVLAGLRRHFPRHT